MNNWVQLVGLLLGGGGLGWVSRTLTARNTAAKDWNVSVLQALVDDKRSMEERIARLEEQVFLLQRELTAAKVLLAKHGIESI